jgi:uncharacterized membrane protein
LPTQARPWPSCYYSPSSISSHQLISSESLAEEIARTRVTSIGLILAVPITTAIATIVTSGTVTGPFESLQRSE